MHSNLLKLTPQKSALQPTVPGNLVCIVNVLAQFCCVVGAAGVFTFDDLDVQGIHGFVAYTLGFQPDRPLPYLHPPNLFWVPRRVLRTVLLKRSCISQDRPPADTPQHAKQLLLFAAQYW